MNDWTLHQPENPSIRVWPEFPDCIQPGQLWQHVETGARYWIRSAAGDDVSVIDESGADLVFRRWVVMRWWCFRVTYLRN